MEVDGEDKDKVKDKESKDKDKGGNHPASTQGQENPPANDIASRTQSKQLFMNWS
jgi:hypothetical protein